MPLCQNNLNIKYIVKYNTSTPVIPTGVHLHMPIPLGCIPVNGLRDVRYQHFSLFGLRGGLTLGPKFTKIGADLLPTQVYHLAKFHFPASTHTGDMRYKNL